MFPLGCDHHLTLLCNSTPSLTLGGFFLADWVGVFWVFFTSTTLVKITPVWTCWDVLVGKKLYYHSHGEEEKQNSYSLQNHSQPGLLLGLCCFCCCFFPTFIKAGSISYFWQYKRGYFRWGNVKPSPELWPATAACGCVLGPAKIRGWRLGWSHGTVCHLHSAPEKEENSADRKVSQGRLLVQSQWKGDVWARKAEYTQ